MPRALELSHAASVTGWVRLRTLRQGAGPGDRPIAPTWPRSPACPALVSQIALDARLRQHLKHTSRLRALGVTQHAASGLTDASVQPNNSFKPTPLRGPAYVLASSTTPCLYAARLNSGVRPQPEPQRGTPCIWRSRQSPVSRSPLARTPRCAPAFTRFLQTFRRLARSPSANAHLAMVR